MNPFREPMKPFPGLERWARTVHLPARNIDLFFYDTGPDENGRPPVILLHGLGDEADTWRHVIPALRASRRVIAPDLPGFGRSEKTQRKHTIPFFCDTLQALIDLLGAPQIALAGHSTGAVIAHAFALDNPHLVEKLVLIGGSMVSKENRLNRDLLFFLIPGLGEWRYNQLRKDSQAAYRSLDAYYHRLDELPQEDRDFLFQRVNERVWSDGQRQGFLSTLRSLAAYIPAQQKGLPERLKSFQVPTSILWGENDRIMPAANAYALKELLPAAQLLLVPNAGHNIQQEQPDAVVQTLR